MPITPFDKAEGGDAPERRRVSRLAASVAISLGLIRVGEFVQTRSEPFQHVAPPAPARAATINVSEPLRVPPAIPSATTGSRVDNAPKPAVKRIVRPIRRAAPPTPRPRREAATPGVLDRLRLGWLRKAFALKRDH